MKLVFRDNFKLASFKFIFNDSGEVCNAPDKIQNQQLNQFITEYQDYFNLLKNGLKAGEIMDSPFTNDEQKLIKKIKSAKTETEKAVIFYNSFQAEKIKVNTETSLALAEYGKKIDKQSQINQMRESLIDKVSKYTRYETVKNSMHFTARFPDNIERQSIIDRFRSDQRFQKLTENLNGRHGLFLDGKSGTLYVISKNAQDKISFDRAYKVTVGEKGVTNPDSYQLMQKNAGGAGKFPYGYTPGGFFIIYQNNFDSSARGNQERTLGKIVSNLDKKSHKGHGKNHNKTLKAITKPIDNFTTGLPHATMTTHAFMFEESGIGFHGTNNENSLKQIKGSGGCLRMANADIIDMSQFINGGTPVYISAPKDGKYEKNPRNFYEKLIV